MTKHSRIGIVLYLLDEQKQQKRLKEQVTNKLHYGVYALITHKRKGRNNNNKDK